MSAILKMLEASKENSTATPDEFYVYCCAAIPEFLLLVSWVESAEHTSLCDLSEYPLAGKCSCGLHEIQSLLRS